MRKLKTICKVFAVAALLPVAFLAFAVSGSAQTLARPGWAGSGLTAQTWSKHAIFYEIDTRTFARGRAEAECEAGRDGCGDLKGIAEHLDYIHSLGVDAIVLEPLSAKDTGLTGGTFSPIDPQLGKLEDFDELVSQASRLKIRVLLELRVPDAVTARFWLTRGVAGFYLPGSTSANTLGVQAIRKLLPTYVGQRVLITDARLATSSKSAANELVLDRAVMNTTGAGEQAEVAALRAALDQSQVLLRRGAAIFALSSTASHEPEAGRLALAAILLNRSASLIVAGQELGLPPDERRISLMPWGIAAPVAAEADAVTEKPAPPVPTSVPDKFQQYVPYVSPAAPKKSLPPDPTTIAGQELMDGSLLQFYRQLSVLHRGNTALHDGEQITLNHDSEGALVWVRRLQAGGPLNSPVLIACNSRAKPLVLSLRPELSRLQLHGSFLRTMLRSDDEMGGASLDRLVVPAFGVFVGELRY